MTATVTLLDAAFTTAVTAKVYGPYESGLSAVRSLTLFADFDSGTGGTTVKAWVQTTIDGDNWLDVASFAFTDADAQRAYHLTNVAVTEIATPTDGSLTDNTSVNGLLGTAFRVKLTTTGTYADANFKITARLE